MTEITIDQGTESKPTVPHFRVSPLVLGPLGAEQLQDPALAVLELVKNAWDADATRVAILVNRKISSGRIAVIDNGHGMTRSEFESRWLVIGASHKREKDKSELERPLIGEKGLGRLSSFALGKSVTLRSSRRSQPGFIAEVDWEEMRVAPSLEEYPVKIDSSRPRIGTRVCIQELRVEWNDTYTEFLMSHAQFLASLPGERFRVSLRVDGKLRAMEDPLSTGSRLAEADMRVWIEADGTPKVQSCIVKGADKTNVVFRKMKSSELDRRLAGSNLHFQFFLRNEAARSLSQILPLNEVAAVLEKYQGIRVYRDGINVPPYGLNGDDWAGLEKQRTSTGGPTLVPGNSQLIGEFHVARKNQTHLIVTAGRSGFSDQAAVSSMANYVRWAVRELGTARRAEKLRIDSPNDAVPSRVDSPKKPSVQNPERIARLTMAQISNSQTVQRDPDLKKEVEAASLAVTEVLDRSEQTLRLYAQLASTGIAATSFAHELRAEFDVVSEGIEELDRGRGRPDQDLVNLLKEAWKRIRSFAALFRVIPVKLRRQRSLIGTIDLRNSIETIAGLAPPEKVKTEIDLPEIRLRLVPAELDSILLNLVSNAIKAVGESERREAGRIRISFQAKKEDLEVRVADNGCGISPKVAKVMFEPLEGNFSEGTGMGLSISRYIAERYGGDVSIASTPTQGYLTEMVVTLKGVVQSP